jgi:2-amino-4-hydroxy-6-hydroxymethyldihydropteridine diphosphokinase
VSAHVAIGLGANLGDPVAALRAAIDHIDALPTTRALVASDVYLTAPIGGPPGQPDYVNAVVLVETSLAPSALLRELQRIELEAGRERTVRFGPRTLDLDILWWEGRVIHEPELQVPHPRLMERRFALEPLHDVLPEAVFAEALATLPDQGVRRLGPIADATIGAIFPDEG